MTGTPASESIDIQQIEKVQEMGEEELDSLPFGAIRLDDKGYIQSFNKSEVNITGRQKKDVLGKHFFREVAPCTNVQEFAGRYQKGVEKGSLHAIFPYHFDYKMEPRDVTITLFYSDATQTGWVFVRESAAQ